MDPHSSMYLLALALATLLCATGARSCFRSRLANGMLSGALGAAMFATALFVGAGPGLQPSVSQAHGVTPADTTAPRSARLLSSAARQVTVSAVLRRIAACESGGDPHTASFSGAYRGKYQFDSATWASVGGSGDPALASAAEQDRRAARLYTERGAQPWPVCGAERR